MPQYRVLKDTQKYLIIICHEVKMRNLLLLVAFLIIACSPSYQLRVSDSNSTDIQKVYNGRELGVSQKNGVLTWVGGYVDDGELYLWVGQRNQSNISINLIPSEITIKYQCAGREQKYFRAIDPHELIAARQKAAANNAAVQAFVTGLNASNAATRTTYGCVGATCGYSKEVDPVARQYYLNSQTQNIQNQYSNSTYQTDVLAKMLLWPMTLSPQQEVGGWVNFGKPPGASCTDGYLVEIPAGPERVAIRLDPNH